MSVEHYSVILSLCEHQSQYSSSVNLKCTSTICSTFKEMSEIYLFTDLLQSIRMRIIQGRMFSVNVLGFFLIGTQLTSTRVLETPWRPLRLLHQKFQALGPFLCVAGELEMAASL